MKALTMTAGGLIACMLAGCASSPPTELKNARTAYQDASQSQGASLSSTSLFEAKKSLDRAEVAFSEEGDAAETRDLAYVAERNAVIAKANGGMALAMQQKQIAMQDAQRIKQDQAMAMRQQLGQTKGALDKSQQQLESERQARVAADQRTAEALSRIKGLTARRTERGLELTISGSVLFATGKSELMPTARKRLDDVVTALKDTPRSLTIVGHTDSVGSDEMNKELSRKRADSVRTYMVTHGFPEDRITAEGAGEAQPVADNKSAEGRANNRRVEIIVQMPPGAQQPMPGDGSSMTPSGGQQGQPGGMQAPSGGMQAPSGNPQDGMREQPPQMQTRPMQPQQKP